jgi:hypothetical protein
MKTQSANEAQVEAEAAETSISPFPQAGWRLVRALRLRRRAGLPVSATVYDMMPMRVEGGKGTGGEKRYGRLG